MSARRIISSLVFCIYIAAVAFLCFMQPDDMPQLPVILFGLPADKVGHFLMFLPFPLLGFLVFEDGQMSMTGKVLTLAILCLTGIGMAFGVEQVQAMLGYRSAETDDIIADATGLACGALLTISHILYRHRK